MERDMLESHATSGHVERLGGTVCTRERDFWRQERSVYSCHFAFFVPAWTGHPKTAPVSELTVYSLDHLGPVLLSRGGGTDHAVTRLEKKKTRPRSNPCHTRSFFSFPFQPLPKTLLAGEHVTVLTSQPVTTPPPARIQPPHFRPR